MRRLLFVLVFTLLTIASRSQHKPFLSDIYSYIENTKVFELNQVEGHVPLVPYTSIDEALKNNR